MAISCRDLIDFMEKRFPLELQESYDNSGFLVGDAGKTIKKVLVCLEVSQSVIEEASEYGVDIIISHHPLIFKSLKSVTTSDETGRCIIELIKRDIAHYASHTCFDNAIGGMNDILFDILGLKNKSVLRNDHPEKLFKVVVFVPETHEEKVREAMLKVGAGHIGAYSHCSFNSKGTGTFLPLDGTTPYIGKQGQLERVREIKVETIVQKSLLRNVVKSLLEAHPYEEPAYDIYPLENFLENGTGRYGELEEPCTLMELGEKVKRSFNTPYVTLSGEGERMVKKVAIVGGGGMDFSHDAALKGCDVIITGDVKHHEALETTARGLCIVDAGHYYTEMAAMPELCRMIAEGVGIECKVSETNAPPFKTI